MRGSMGGHWELATGGKGQTAASLFAGDPRQGARRLDKTTERSQHSPVLLTKSPKDFLKNFTVLP